ncbi:hypothetical protein [Flavobacterium silvaticum]|uniref:Uncharacterized protein n=1 Tax=Flavobacterium silvaticum TaxID=1852020 RepID=A0A972FK36_9FLAO|nr:hypothetical protein [Flavobacterium silvaticum]NMH27228.1 hypothetical protein [Flavobacterium silvaticum]
MKLFVWLLIACPFFTHSQIVAEHKSTSVLDADVFLGYDNLGALYFTKDNAIFKSTEVRTVQYKNISLGKIERVDLQNPLNIVLLYPNFNTVVMLDNQLNETKKISFSDLSEPLMVTACGNASQNRLWIYNSITQQIGLLDYTKNSYKPITQQLSGKFVFYQTDFNNFYWMTDQRQLFVCDVFGKIRSLGKLPDFDAARITSDKTAIYLKDNMLRVIDLDTGESKSIETGKKSLSSFWYSPQNLTIFTDRGLSTYKIQLP